MTKPTSKNRFLAHAVLSSTFFVTPLALATTFGPGIFGGQNTNAQPDNIVEVLTTGQILNAGGTGVLLNSSGGTIITDPNNTFVGNSSILSIGGPGIDVSSPDGIVDIGTATGVVTINNNAINIQATATNTQIFNAGIVASTTAEAILNNGANTTINNQAGGVIVQPSADANTIRSTANDLAIINAGLITQSFAGNTSATIRLETTPFDVIINQSGGIIQNLNGTATSHAIDVVSATNGDIINNAGGLIYTGSGSGNAIHIFSDTTGNIINNGTLQTITAATPTISLEENVNSIINNGNIIATSGNAILAGVNVQIPEMIINNGNIGLSVAGNAINLAANGVQATVVQNGGDVFGNILLAPLDSSGGSNVFFMNGGTIYGNVVATGASVLALNGGTVSSSVIGSGLGDTLNLAGTNILFALFGGNANDIFNVTSGSYGVLDGGTGIDVANFKNTFKSNGNILNIETINIENGTLTLNSPISGMGAGLGGSGLVINPSATLRLNASISGTNNITNSGTIDTNSAQVITLTGAGTVTNNTGSIVHLGTGAGLEILTDAANGFTGATGSTLQVDLASATQYGHMIVRSPNAGGVTFNALSVISPQVKGFVPQGAVFNIVQNTGTLATIVDNASLKQSSAVVSFNKSLNFANNQLLLTARRNPYEIFAIDPTQGLASALDFAARGDGPSDPNLAYLMGQIDGLSTASEVSDALIALTPPANNSLVQASFIGMNTAFERINERLYDLHLWMQQQAELNSGVNSGDKFGVLGFWAQALGAHLNQHERDGLDGYDANSGGLALGVDWRYNDCTALGFAISYNKAKVNDHEANPKDENIRSWQGTSYAWIDYANGMYINAIMGLAFNDYDVDRTIRFNQINTVSNGNFNGWQFGLQTDAGWFLINNNDYFVTPFARLKYTLLSLDNYTETGAGPLSLRVDNESIDQLLGGMGVKFGKPFTSKHLVFIPEVTTLVSYDFVNDGEQSTSSFVGNSLEFATNGVKPGRAAFDLGVGVSTHIDEQSIFTIKYDLELRDKFNANSAYLEYYYLWG